MSAVSKYLSNAQVMTDYPDGFCVYNRSFLHVWKADRSSGVLTVTLQDEKPALVMNRKYAEPYKSFTKKEYQSVHNGSADEALVKEMLSAYEMGINSFREELRTIGCGSSVYFQCADGLYQACVQRTAPSKTPEGVVQPGAFSRAAGGATGHLQETQTRELIEEMNVFVRKNDGSVVSIDLFRTDGPVYDQTQLQFIEAKRSKLGEIYNLLAPNVTTALPSLTSEVFEAHAIEVDNLHETVEERISGLKHRFRAVVADDPKNGDLSGVDCLLVVPMQQYHSSQIFIVDGERDQENKLLNRKWMLAKPEFLAANQSAGMMKFSPVFAKTLQSTSEILQEISRFNP